MTQQGDLQASVRAITGTAYDFNGDMMAMFDGAGIAQGSYSGRLLAWINSVLGANYAEVNGAMQAYAATLGAFNWSSLNTINPFPGATAALSFVGPVSPTIPYYNLNGVAYSSLSSIPGWTFTRASSKTAVSSAGTIISFGPNVPAITDLGLLYEESRTNSFLNSAVGVTQSVTTTAASWTVSFYGTGSIVLSGGATGTLNGTGANNRVSLTVTATAASTTLTVTGSVTNVQFEAGAFVTSYIPTTGAPVTRAADSASITGLTAPAAYTIIGRFNRFVGANSQAVFNYSTGANANSLQMRLRNVGSNFSTNVTSGGAAQWSPVDAGTELGVGVAQTVGIALGAGAGVNAANGTIITTVGSLVLPVAPSILTLGASQDGSNPLNGYLQRIALYPFAASAGQLQGLTQ
jgi:hypothetical protein